MPAISPTSFADRLISEIRKKQTPLIVGLDPRLDSLPQKIGQGVERADFAAIAGAYRKFCCEVIDVVAPLVPAVKPQAAFFEAIGPLGMQALSDVIKYARSKGLLVVMDAKRGDIGSTAAAYAAGWLGQEGSAWGCDALTVNPWLGDDSLDPFVQQCIESDAGIFILVRTSNPGGAMIQELPVENEPLYTLVARHVQQLAMQSLGDCGYGSVGAVIGATHPDQLAQLRSSMPNTLFLVPGIGAQGATASDVAGAFDDNGLGAIINSSRAIIFAHARSEFADETDWVTAVERATKSTIGELETETTAGLLKRSR